MNEQKVREWWIVLNRHYEAIWRYKNAAELDAAAYPPSAVVHVREVLPGPSVEQLQAENARLRNGLEEIRDFERRTINNTAYGVGEDMAYNDAVEVLSLIAERALSGEGDKA